MREINVVYIISDTLRRDYLGFSNKKDVYTPNIDSLHKDSVSFKNAYSESLPTIPVRRALFTGRRVFPCGNFKYLKGVGIKRPCWRPLRNDVSTLPEILAGEGYHTGFVTDVKPYFEPNMNFTRGFKQWKFVRGQLNDPWQSPNTVSPSELTPYGDPHELADNYYFRQVIANMQSNPSEESTTTGKTFRWAMDFIDDNRNAQPFFLMIDCWDPHEAWIAPDSYLEMYANPNFNGRTIPHPKYNVPRGDQMSKEELEHCKSHYKGLISLFDFWLGQFMEKMKRLDLWEDLLIVFLSDHGTNFADNPKNIVGKPSCSLYPSLMNIPLMIRFPGGTGAGETYDHFVYNINATATIYEYLKINGSGLDYGGQNLYNLIETEEDWKNLGYLTSRFFDYLWYRDNKWWAIFEVSGSPEAIFNLEKDPSCNKNILPNVDHEITEKIWNRILQDAGGEIPVHEGPDTDALGRNK